MPWDDEPKFLIPHESQGCSLSQLRGSVAPVSGVVSDRPQRSLMQSAGSSPLPNVVLPGDNRRGTLSQDYLQRFTLLIDASHIVG